MARIKYLTIGEHVSDGLTSRWPAKDSLSRNDDKVLYQVGKWLARDRHLSQSNTEYKLNQFPAGYAAFEKPPRQDGTGQVDRYIYGHPQGCFDSAKKFTVHLLAIERNNLADCECVRCGGKHKHKKSTKQRSSTLITPNQRRQQKLASTSPLSTEQRREQAPSPLSDEVPHSSDGSAPEYLADQFGQLVDRLGQLQYKLPIDCALEEPSVPVWLYTMETIAHSLRKLQQQPSYCPRPGEMVLLAANLRVDDTLV
ncbi:hypothetical protein AMS68_003732 [Peltaster fructicola]|uniref:Cryptic loci regulator 2 N-terminal domain-containing protein n=1 Tax=Peltaster fructicola TaxID=286661 RepID=A0A6H0XU92_9PEZI|nr:hypothetical protein AMS68_003732 [Peltaster fructicola]